MLAWPQRTWVEVLTPGAEVAGVTGALEVSVRRLAAGALVAPGLIGWRVT